jgi:hypothetical protein
VNSHLEFWNSDNSLQKSFVKFSEYLIWFSGFSDSVSKSITRVFFSLDSSESGIVSISEIFLLKRVVLSTFASSQIIFHCSA